MLISTSLIPGACSADKGLFSALITAISKAGCWTIALAVCLKQIYHVTQTEQLQNVYAVVNLFSDPLLPQFGAGTNEPWKFTCCHHDSDSKSQNWPRSTSQMCHRPRHKEELIPLFSWFSSWLNMEMPSGYPELTQQDGCIEYYKQDSRAQNVLLLQNIVTTEVHSAKISNHQGPR